MKIKAALLAIFASLVAAPAISQTTPTGYFRIQQGVYGQWCWEECISESELYGTGYIGLRVWCKESTCGSVTGNVSFYSGKTVVDQYGDQMTLSRGQSGILLFQTTRPDVDGFSHTIDIYPLR